MYLFVDGKDCSNGDETVDVGGAIQRIKAHNVFALEEKNEPFSCKQTKALLCYTPKHTV